MRKLALVIGAASAAVLSAVAGAASTAESFSYRATMTTRAEVPKPKAAATAAGVFTATVRKDASASSIRWTLTFRNLSGKAVAAHVHRGKPGVAGAVVLALCGPCKTGQKGFVAIPRAAADLLQRGGGYVNVHTAKNPAGEIRGQVKLVGRKTIPDGSPSPSPTDPGDAYPDYP